MGRGLAESYQDDFCIKCSAASRRCRDALGEVAWSAKAWSYCSQARSSWSAGVALRSVPHIDLARACDTLSRAGISSGVGKWCLIASYSSAGVLCRLCLVVVGCLLMYN